VYYSGEKRVATQFHVTDRRTDRGTEFLWRCTRSTHAVCLARSAAQFPLV